MWKFICAKCRSSLRVATNDPVRAAGARQGQIRPSSSKRPKLGGNHQAHPLTGYYQDILSSSQEVGPVTRSMPQPPPPESLPQTAKEERLQKARIVFGSKLAGPKDRRNEMERKSVNVAGILVPPKPQEPDNCCMSGCVNCVWDLYRDDMEEWAARSAEARARIVTQRGKEDAARRHPSPEAMNAKMPLHVANSMDDDGGGSETNWDLGLLGGGSSDGADLFSDIPVGIREFMRTEKMLKQKHRLEQHNT